MQTIQIRLTKELLGRAQELVDKGIYSNKSEVVRDSLRRLTFFDELKTDAKRKFLVAYSSDLHGNFVQYKKLFKTAFIQNANAIIIGGDIAPKDHINRTIEKQREFFEFMGDTD